jgi:hypothetical protein
VGKRSERAVQVGRATAREQVSERCRWGVQQHGSERASGAGSGMQWENVAAVSGVRRSVQMRIKDMEMSRE